MSFERKAAKLIRTIALLTWNSRANRRFVLSVAQNKPTRVPTMFFDKLGLSQAHHVIALVRTLYTNVKSPWRTKVNFYEQLLENFQRKRFLLKYNQAWIYSFRSRLKTHNVPDVDYADFHTDEIYLKRLDEFLQTAYDVHNGTFKWKPGGVFQIRDAVGHLIFQFSG